ncbi:conjugative transposon protein TraM [Mucilaginibacter corticis]|uniref:Conjugative transposon protein TraM n=1 Tax=Mucilaginibacter corticis TaxID=2597670 RepID=A0A556MLZ0_9SPHI|nr:conjugative transposon protein TraM [Mucilaginibacter corticis]TSJ40941.1 conjugative transposon protein TraM [Mucilaginibacter corticis]
MKINFKQPKYIVPVILLPFLCLFFFIYQSTFGKKTGPVKKENGLNSNVGDVSADVRKKQLENKLDAYRSSYKDADGRGAVGVLPAEPFGEPAFDKQKKLLDSINRTLKSHQSDQVMAQALNHVERKAEPQTPGAPVANDPMQTFRQQMTYIDSMNKANDPAVKAEQKKAAAQTQQKIPPALAVQKAKATVPEFNTIAPRGTDDPIKVVIDENLTGYAGSRIRLRLLDDINAGGCLITKGTYLYALISGFSGQRVNLAVRSILYGSKILPVKLEVYDLDGLAGLYVPGSSFRDFTKDLGTNTINGVSLDGNSSLVMSTIGKMFESTSSAISGLIRKDKAKIKYNSYLYLIDTENK